MPTEFEKKVYALCKKIPIGKVGTYKEIGKALKRKGQVYRAVGRALKNNQYALKVPCHRIVNSDGSIGGFNKGIKKKIALLKKEGIEIKNGKIINFGKRLFKLNK